jgi:hypothetical protein
MVAAERARVANEGWGARLLALQGQDGQWAGGACFPARSLNWREENQGQPWTSTLPTLQLLCEFGIDPLSDRVRRVVVAVREHCRWEHAGQLPEQLADGGWNCEMENGSVRSSFATTINVLEGLWAHERARVALRNRLRLGAGARSTSTNES